MISVVVPVYNVEKYLDKCIQSLVNQTYKDIEIILVNDGSSDSSGVICDNWAQKDHRVVVIHQSNCGVSSARNAALKAAKGEYFAFVDADDYVDENMLSELINAISDETDMAVCGFNTVFNNEIRDTSCDTEQLAQGAIVTRNLIEKTSWGLVIWNKLIKRSAISSADGDLILFPEDLFIGEDALWILMVSQNCKNVSYVAKPMYYYIKRQGSAVFKSTNERLIESCISRYDAAFRSYTFLKNVQNPYAYMIFRRCVFSARDIACECYIKGNAPQYEKWIKKLFEDLKKYKSLVGKSEDKMFIFKNYILYFSMRLHFPKSLVIKLLKVKQN